jgi:NADH-quinone oxidoreductase subunit C
MKAVDEIRDVLREKFPQAPFQTDETGRAGTQWSVMVPISGTREAARAFDAAGFFLETMTCLDFMDTFELVYHFNRYEPASRVSVRVLCGHDQKAESISDIFRGAGWLEREVHEFYGIDFAGSSDMRPLLLPEDADYYPLRKTFGKIGAYHKREKIYD